MFTKAFRESTTLKFVSLAIGLLFFRFAVAGMDFGYGQFDSISAESFSLSFAGIMAVWVVRETKESYFKSKR